MKKMLIITLVLSGLLIAACRAQSTPTPEAGLPNPASVFCEEQGYRLEMREEAGGTVGYCIFPDGSECEEWAFYRGECTPADTTFDSPLALPNAASQYCQEQGYRLEMREEAGGTVGYCIFPDGSECEEWAFYRGECTPADTTFDSPLGLPNPASQYCQDQGYELEMRTTEAGTTGYCLFPDGSECEEWAFYRGECEPGTSQP